MRHFSPREDEAMVGTDEVVLDEETIVVAEKAADPTLAATEALVPLFCECFFFDHAPVRLEVIVFREDVPNILAGAVFDGDAMVELMGQFQFSLWRTSMMTTRHVQAALRHMLEPVLRTFIDQGIVLSPSVTAHAVTQDKVTVLYLHIG
jgi:hypothetical protein